MMNQLGDKIKSKLVANSVGVPTIPGVEQAIQNEQEALELQSGAATPLCSKQQLAAAAEGTRIVSKAEDFPAEFNSARNEAKKAFGIDDIFIENTWKSQNTLKCRLWVTRCNIVHLYERDCSIQRRHQKVVEFTPAFALTEEQRQKIVPMRSK